MQRSVERIRRERVPAYFRGRRGEAKFTLAGILVSAAVLAATSIWVWKETESIDLSFPVTEESPIGRVPIDGYPPLNFGRSDGSRRLIMAQK